MSTERQTEANRANAKKGSGPRTEKGKQASRTNSFKHGFSSANFGVSSAEVRQIAAAICQDDPASKRYEQALIIAESELAIRRIRAARIGALREIPRPEIFITVLEKAYTGDSRPLARFLRRQSGALRRIVRDISEGKPRNLVDACIACGFPPFEENYSEADLVARAIPVLRKLDRYEQRAMSRRRRAIQMFDALGVMERWSMTEQQSRQGTTPEGRVRNQNAPSEQVPIQR
jgi:hypothetical protein